MFSQKAEEVQDGLNYLPEKKKNWSSSGKPNICKGVQHSTKLA